MPLMRTPDEVCALWTDWQGACARAPCEDPVGILRDRLSAQGTRLSVNELRHALEAAGPLPGIARDRFVDCIVPLLGDRALRLDHAFGYLGRPDGAVPVAALRAVLLWLFGDAAALDRMLADLDADGDRMLTRADFHGFHPSDAGTRAGHYRASPVMPARIGTAAAAAPSAAMAPPAPTAPPGMDGDAISPLQLQVGFFRLLQGAAYRSFRENFAANSESHLRARDLPYTIADFARFVHAAVEFYLSLGIVTGAAARAEFARLTEMVTEEVRALEDRVARWPDIATTPGMRAAEAQVEHALAETADHRAMFARAVEFLLALRQQAIAPSEVRDGCLDRHELNRLRQLELQAEHGHHTPAPASGPPVPYHDSWTPVILDADRPNLPGAIMPVAFWYDRFMPQLLLCASIRSDADLAAERATDAVALERWHATARASGVFDAYATDLRDGFAACTLPVRRSLKQAWRLTEHYLNGLEKRREREEFGRETGFLSQYVAFIDLPLGRSDVARAEMRLSFPYYIGPAVWCLLHTGAELVEALPQPARVSAIAAFKTFFRGLATMYPCPYCRYHLNRYVVPNREVGFYPAEFLLLGRPDGAGPAETSIEDRLGGIAADRPGSLRLFLWKLHNAVSSSIARTEDWYHREARPLYTSRFWPGLEAEIARARAQGRDHVPLDRLSDLVAVVKPAAALAGLRDEMLRAGGTEGAPLAPAIRARTQEEVARLDAAIEASGLLSRTYAYDPERVDAPPHVTARAEAFARSGAFTER